ncbi:polyketide cyclase [Mucilaginibacter hurinus]|uniref:Polyketide cyclase n=1 Tax=Mucilaginibacter hurinus TaxID=2201324 RepID=A0A367GPN9_9SPHI|nr:SRPBCC family protein [Mucilaginibacter hurinus]RCH55434.1 polyketide cyclase [Mucilaginibacter hurinus]
METANNTLLTVETTVNAPITKVWDYWNAPEHITQWCQASDDWQAPAAENDLRIGGKFFTTMAAKDGSFSFDFGGEYTDVEQYKRIAYTMSDGRKVQITFTSEGDFTHVTETFDAEQSNSLEMQQAGWQAILNSFKKYTGEN